MEVHLTVAVLTYRTRGKTRAEALEHSSSAISWATVQHGRALASPSVKHPPSRVVIAIGSVHERLL